MTVFHLLSEPDDGELSRVNCAHDLDLAIADGTSGGASVFLARWGEELRILIRNHDVNLDEAHGEGFRKGKRDAA